MSLLLNADGDRKDDSRSTSPFDFIPSPFELAYFELCWVGYNVTETRLGPPGSTHSIYHDGHGIEVVNSRKATRKYPSYLNKYQHSYASRMG